MSMKTLLEEEIQEEFKDLKKLSPGSDEHKTAVDSLAKLVDRVIEIDKVENDADQQNADRENDAFLKGAQMEADERDRKIRNGIAIAGIVIPTAVTIWGTLKSFKFEETGTVTTILGRGFINKLLPKK